MTIDHLVYGAPDLAAAVDDLAARFGVRAQPGGKHHGIGTRNALLALGPRTYLEVLAPDPDQPPPSNPRPFGIDELTSPRLVGWAVGCDDIDTAIAGARAAGYDPGDAIEMTRTGATGTVLRWRLTLNQSREGRCSSSSHGGTPSIPLPRRRKASRSKRSKSSIPTPSRSQRPSVHWAPTST